MSQKNIYIKGKARKIAQKALQEIAKLRFLPKWGIPREVLKSVAFFLFFFLLWFGGFLGAFFFY